MNFFCEKYVSVVMFNVNFQTAPKSNSLNDSDKSKTNLSGLPWHLSAWQVSAESAWPVPPLEPTFLLLPPPATSPCSSILPCVALSQLSIGCGPQSRVSVGTPIAVPLPFFGPPAQAFTILD